MSKPKLKTQNFFFRVYQVVKKIPKGKVATYGQIAKIIQNSDIEFGVRSRINSQIVGWALHDNKDPTIPCHRVVNREGKLAKNFSFGGWEEQKRRLEEEGVKVVGKKVDLRKYLLN